MRMEVYDNVRKERHQNISPALTTGVRTMWNSDHIETSRASANHSGL